MGYEYSLIPYPHFRPTNLFNAFVLTAISMAIVSAFSMELRSYVIQRQLSMDKKGDSSKHFSYIPFDAKLLRERLISVTISTFLVSFLVYVLMYFIAGFGGGMVAPKRKWRFFTSIKA